MTIAPYTRPQFDAQIRKLFLLEEFILKTTVINPAVDYWNKSSNERTEKNHINPYLQGNLNAAFEVMYAGMPKQVPRAGGAATSPSNLVSGRCGALVCILCVAQTSTGLTLAARVLHCNAAAGVRTSREMGGRKCRRGGNLYFISCWCIMGAGFSVVGRRMQGPDGRSKV